MLVRDLRDCEEVIAGDDSLLRELLHPDTSGAQIRYSLAHAKVPPGQKTRPHKLRGSEVYYVLAGRGVMHVDEESREVQAGCAVYIPPDATQYIENMGDGDLAFLCIVDPPWRAEEEEIL